MKNYLLIAEKINTINQQFLLKPNEIELLDVIAKYHVENKLITVSDLIINRPIASPGTLHAVLKSLIHKRLVIAKVDMRDGRKKAVSLTKLSLDRYKMLNRLMSA